MTEQTSTSLLPQKSQEKSDLSRYLPEVYMRKISWVPFILTALLASVIGGIGISFGSMEVKVFAFAAIIGIIVVMAIYQKPELGAYLLTIMVLPMRQIY